MAIVVVDSPDDAPRDDIPLNQIVDEVHAAIIRASARFAAPLIINVYCPACGPVSVQCYQDFVTCHQCKGSLANLTITRHDGRIYVQLSAYRSLRVSHPDPEINGFDYISSSRCQSVPFTWTEKNIAEWIDEQNFVLLQPEDVRQFNKPPAKPDLDKLNAAVRESVAQQPEGTLRATKALSCPTCHATACRQSSMSAGRYTCNNCGSSFVPKTEGNLFS